ncbi:MAG: hypothetical protein M3441_28620 [Chloroflexota bacterium]|nr:hypothetical protein [Chloroflexota bacterium]
MCGSRDSKIEISKNKRPEADEQLDLLIRMIDRSDRLRASYANRAAIVFSANALVLTTIGVLTGKVKMPFPLNLLVVLPIVVAIILVSISVLLALKASTGFSSSSNDEARFPTEHRFIFNPADTFLSVQAKFDTPDNNYQSCQKFMGKYQSLSYEKLIRMAGAELWVAYILQRKRNNHLKNSITFLLCAFFSLIFILLIVVPASFFTM